MKFATEPKSNSIKCPCCRHELEVTTRLAVRLPETPRWRIRHNPHGPGWFIEKLRDEMSWLEADPWQEWYYHDSGTRIIAIFAAGGAR